MIDHFNYDAATGATDHAAVLASNYVQVGVPARPSLGSLMQSFISRTCCTAAAAAAAAAVVPLLLLSKEARHTLNIPFPLHHRARLCCPAASRLPCSTVAWACPSRPAVRRCATASGTAQQGVVELAGGLLNAMGLLAAVACPGLTIPSANCRQPAGLHCSQAFAALRGSPTAYSGRTDAAQTDAKLAGPALTLVALVQVGAEQSRVAIADKPQRRGVGSCRACAKCRRSASQHVCGCSARSRCGPG